MYREVGTCDYIIKDRLAGDQYIVNVDLLGNKEFNISGWFAEQKSRALGLTERLFHRCPIGDAIAVVTKKLLNDGVSSSYPCTNDGLDPADRFWVQRAEGDTDEYIIVDLDLCYDFKRFWVNLQQSLSVVLSQVRVLVNDY